MSCRGMLRAASRVVQLMAFIVEFSHRVNNKEDYGPFVKAALVICLPSIFFFGCVLFADCTCACLECAVMGSGCASDHGSVPEGWATGLLVDARARRTGHTDLC